MRVYYFDVTLRVQHKGRPLRAVVPRAARAADEHRARRGVLDHYLGLGFLVARLDRVARPAPGGERVD